MDCFGEGVLQVKKRLSSFRDPRVVKAHKIKHKDLALWLGIAPQGMSDVFKGRNQPTGEEVSSGWSWRREVSLDRVWVRGDIFFWQR
jgi:hypothetical protein